MLTNYHENLTKIWPIERSQGCLFIIPLDLIIDPGWPTFKLGLEIIKAYMLTKFHEVPMTNVAYREVTMLSLYLTHWPSYWTQMTNVRTWPRNHQGVHADKISWSSDDKCGLQRGHKPVPLFDPWPDYWPQMTYVRTWPRNHQGLHADQISWSSNDKCGL